MKYMKSPLNILNSIITDSLYKNSIYLTINNIALSLSGLLFWVVVTKFYSDADIGLAVALISSSALIVGISKLGLDASLVRFLPKEQDQTRFINICLTLTGLLTVFLSIIFIIFINNLEPKLSYIFLNHSYAISSSIFLISTTEFALVSIVFVALRLYGYYLLINMFCLITRFFLPIFFANSSGSFGIINSWSISYILAIVLSIALIKRVISPYHFYPSFKFPNNKEVLTYSLVNNVTNIVGGFLISVFPFIIIHFLTTKDVAYFYVAYAFSNAMLLIPGATSTSLFTESTFQERTFSLGLKKSLIYSYSVLFLAIPIIALFGEKVLLLFGKSYSANGFQLLLLLAISSILSVLISFYNIYLKLNFKIREMLVLTIIADLAISMIAYLLIGFCGIGIIGIGYAHLAVYFVVNIYILVKFGNYIYKNPGGLRI